MAFQSKTKEIQFIRHFVATKIPEGSSTVSTGLQRTRSTKRNLISTSRAREDDNAFIPHTYTYVCLSATFLSFHSLDDQRRPDSEDRRIQLLLFFLNKQIWRIRKGRLKFDQIRPRFFSFSEDSFYLSFFDNCRRRANDPTVSKRREKK